MTTRQFQSQSQSQPQSQSHLPPRCPIQKKPVHGSIPESHTAKSLMGNHPQWLDDLLTDPESGPHQGLRPLRRSVSDSVTLLDSVADSFSIISTHYDEGSLMGDQTCCGLESDSSMYGPNSPRLRSGSSFSESAIVSALSECVSQESGQYMDSVGHSDMLVPDNELNADARTAKRHPGQRSRIRKLQYIAELERTVDVLQTLESDLAFRVASVLQQRAALSLENNKLKQQLARTRREKLIVDDQHQMLKKEVKRLRTSLSNTANGRIGTCFRPNSAAEAGSLAAMQMAFDMENLNLY